MDTPGVSIRPLIAATLVCLALFLAACSRPEPPPVVVVAPAKSPTPIPPDPISVQHPINVVFDSYSKDWPQNWQFVDPEEKTSPTVRDHRSGVLKLTVPRGKRMSADEQNAPRFIKTLNGDFIIETRVNFEPVLNYQAAGLMIYGDNDHFILLQRSYGGPAGVGGGISMDIRSPGRFDPVVRPVETEAPVVDLRLVRTGAHFEAFWRADEKAEWQKVGDTYADLRDPVLAGIIACNTASEMTAEFDYIHLLPNKPRPGKH